MRPVMRHVLLFLLLYVGQINGEGCAVIDGAIVCRLGYKGIVVEPGRVLARKRLLAVTHVGTVWAQAGLTSVALSRADIERVWGAICERRLYRDPDLLGTARVTLFDVS